MILIAALVIGIVAGLRAMTAPAAVSWAARLGWLPLQRHVARACSATAVTPWSSPCWRSASSSPINYPARRVAPCPSSSARAS